MTEDSLPVIPPSSVEKRIEEAQDISARIIELMRRVDRLPPGVYEITIIKPEVRAMEWTGEITRLERVETLRLSKYYKPE